MGRQFDNPTTEHALRARLSKTPDDKETRLQLARFYLQGQRPADALEVLAKLPDDDVALLKCLALAALGRVGDALLLSELAATQSDEPLLMHSLAYWLNQRSRWPAAILLLQSAVHEQPDNGGVHHDLAIALQASGKQASALQHYQIAIGLEPGNPHLAFNFALALEQDGQLEMARDQIKVVRRLLPAHLGALYREGYLNRMLCDWNGIDDYRATLSKAFDAHIAERGSEMISPYGLNIHDLDPVHHDRAASYYAQQIAAQCRSLESSKPLGSKALHEKKQRPIRLGYLSPDFHSHAVGGLISGLFACHDRSQFEVSAFSLAERDDEIRQEISTGVDRYVDLSADSFDQAAATIERHGIDILIDLGGYTRGARPQILAQRPAPLQISFLGYLNTMCAPFIDALIADEVVVPIGEESIYAERVLRLPRCFLPATQRLVPEQPSRAAVGLPADAFVFCSFNHSYKIDPHCFSLWADILEKAPDSVLWLLGDRAAIRDHLMARARDEGLDQDRLIFADRVPLDAHLARMQAADLFLDTPGYNAGATAIASVQAGLPVLTLRGQRILGRMGASLNHYLGLAELICEDDIEYVAKGVELAHSPDRLRKLRTQLGESFAQRFSIAGYCRDLESGLLELWGGADRRRT